MLYAILCYHDEDVTGSWTPEQDAAVMKKLAVVQDKLAKQGRLGPVARLLPTTSTKPSTSRAISAWPIRAAPTRFARSACFSPERSRNDRHRLDRCRADLGASPGGRRALALFPQSRHRRGGLPERLVARTEKLAAKRAAA